MNREMNYNEAVNYLFTQLPVFENTGGAYKPGLKTATAMDDAFGNPHRKYKTIHIAGTNGKGSVSNFLASVLQEAGYRTGLFTSPHIVDFKERIRVNGKKIDEQFVADFVNNYADIAGDDRQPVKWGFPSVVWHNDVKLPNAGPDHLPAWDIKDDTSREPRY